MKIKLSKENISLFLCYLTISAYIFLGNCATFNIGNRLPIKLAEIISAVTIITLLLFKTKIKFTQLNKHMFIWIAFGMCSVLINTVIYKYEVNNVFYGMLYPLRLIHLLLLTSLIVNTFNKYKTETKKIIDYIIINYMAVCMVGVVQLYFYPKASDFYNIFYKLGVYFPNPDPHIGRLLSTYFDPNYLAQCLSIPLAFSMIYWIKYDKKRYLLSILVIILTIILTVSRSGFLSLGIVLAVIFLLCLKQRKITKKIFCFYVIIGVLTIAALLFSDIRIFDRIVNTTQDKSTISRVDNWSGSLDIIKDNSIIGIGYNMIGFYKTEVLNLATSNSTMFGSDSSLLLIVMTTGIIGALWCIYALIKYIKKIYGKKEESNAIIAIIVAALVGCNFINLLFYVLWLFPFLIIVNKTSVEEKE